MDNNKRRESILNWSYFLGVIIVPDRITSLLIDYTVLVICYLSYTQGTEDWAVRSNSLEVLVSKSSEFLINKCKPKMTLEDAIKEIKANCPRYRTFKFF